MRQESPTAQSGFRIGLHEFRHGLSLAPMAGNTNLAYRRLCRRFGAELTTTEMVSSKALVHGDGKSLQYLEKGEEENPVAAQVFGMEPEILAGAAPQVEAKGFHILDLNIGCPVPKITGCGGGSALLKDPELAADCVRAMKESTSLPVTVKIRAGWDDDNKNAPSFAEEMQEAGVSAITVHGRTREQKYKGTADLDLIRRVVESVSIPVLGNGDILDLDSAKRMFETTGCAGLAIGRGALGRPWIFRDIAAWLSGETPPPEPDLRERAELLLELGRGITQLYGEDRGMKIMRRLAPDFFKGVEGAPLLRGRCNSLESWTDLEELAATFGPDSSL